MKVQRTPSLELSTYSMNMKINSVLRTLIALNGKEQLWTAVVNYVQHEGGVDQLTQEEIWELYQLTKLIVSGRI